MNITLEALKKETIRQASTGDYADLGIILMIDKSPQFQVLLALVIEAYNSGSFNNFQDIIDVAAKTIIESTVDHKRKIMLIAMLEPAGQFVVTALEILVDQPDNTATDTE